MDIQNAINISALIMNLSSKIAPMEMLCRSIQARELDTLPEAVRVDMVLKGSEWSDGVIESHTSLQNIDIAAAYERFSLGDAMTDEDVKALYIFFKLLEKSLSSLMSRTPQDAVFYKVFFIWVAQSHGRLHDIVHARGL